jgi:hypothetical protein
MSAHWTLRRAAIRTGVAALVFLALGTTAMAESEREVVLFFDFPFPEDFPGSSAPVNYWPFETDVGSRAATGFLTAFIGAAINGDKPNLDPDGGKGIFYTSNTSGTSYAATRSLHFEDLKGKGDDFEIDGSSVILQDRGQGTVEENFSNDANVYIYLDGQNYSDFELRFDVQVEETTPATSFDLFYRTTGAHGVFYRAENNTSLNIDSEFNGSATVTLPAALDRQSNIEIILTDFDEGDVANGDLELDNIEITAVPEPGAALGAITTALGVGALRKKRETSLQRQAKAELARQPKTPESVASETLETPAPSSGKE